MKRITSAAAACLGIWGAAGMLGLATPAAAQTGQNAPVFLGFTGVPGDGSLAASVGPGQLSAQLTSNGTNGACLTFRNTGAKALTVTNIFLQAKPWLQNASIKNGDVVTFQQDGVPGSFPTGGTGPSSFQTSMSFTSISNPTQGTGQVPGLDPGETFGLCFDFVSGMTFQDVLNAINSGQLRIGITAQGENGVQGSLVSFHSACHADVNGDGLAKVTDFLLYLDMYQNANPLADLNGDNNVNIQDFTSFLNAFATGCPSTGPTGPGAPTNP